MSGPIVELAQGRARGREKRGVLLFAGLPYAAPPVGERRFAPPAPHPGWSGERDATRFGNASLQRPRPGGLTDAPPRHMDEDCLLLNVQTPALDDARRPVLVWIHGGGFRAGQGGIPWYDGSSFALQGDIVTVSINYRLGALGFANLAELEGGDGTPTSGLNGILDQVAALEWVRENIAAFGGDPEQVTIAGESAGGMSVGTLLGLPAARGLFRRAIPQSGAGHHTHPVEASREIGRAFARFAGVDSLAALRGLPVERILDAQDAVEKEVEGRADLGMAWMPTVDGSHLPQAPIDAVRAGASADVPVMVGTTAHETTLFGMTAEDEERVRRIAGRSFDDPDAALAAYRADHPDASPTDLLVALTTDQTFRIPAVRLAEAIQANGGRAYKYLFSWESRAFGGRLRSCHALEIPFAFNNLERAGVATFLGEGPLPQHVADAMHAAWIAFVRQGDPNAEALPEWPTYEPGERHVMEFGDEVAARKDPQANSRALWEGVR